MDERGLAQRKRTRLEGYDYRRAGWYFVTVCCLDRRGWFGDVRDAGMVLSEVGGAVEERWQWLGKHYSCVELGPHMVMPNHLHALIALRGEDGNRGTTGNGETADERGTAGNGETEDDRGTTGNGETEDDRGTTGNGPVATGPYRGKSLSGLIGAFKTTAAKAIHGLGYAGFRWQRSFHDRIVRDDRE